MDNLFDAVGIVVNNYTQGSTDFGELFDDPDSYFGLELLDPENLYEQGTTGELPPFIQNVEDFGNDPSLSTFIGIIPGVGGTYQSGVNVVDNIVDLPTWVTGDNGVEGSLFENAFDSENTEEEITFGESPQPPVSPVVTSPSTVEDDCCCCCC